jgi:pilus assembly protein Flp/PilA
MEPGKIGVREVAGGIRFDQADSPETANGLHKFDPQPQLSVTERNAEPHGEYPGEVDMSTSILKLSVYLQTKLMQEEGQDLVEYALVVALIAFGALTAMGTLANDINTVFNNIATKLTSAA